MVGQLLRGQLVFYSKFKSTRLLERFAPIFYLSCEHVLFVNIEKQKTKIRRFLKQKIVDFQDLKNFTKIKSF